MIPSPNYLDDLPQYTLKTVVVLAALGKQLRLLFQNSGHYVPVVRKMRWYKILITGANDTTLDQTLRLQLLTLLVNSARLNQMPTPVGVFNISFSILPTEIATVPFGLISGTPSENAALVAYIAAQVGASSRFDGDQPIVLASGKSFGKYVDGDTAAWDGLTAVEAMIDAVTEYLAPQFSSFSFVGFATTVEVGTTISAGNKTAAWGTSNSDNVEPDTISIEDTTNDVVLAEDLANDGSQTVNFPDAIVFSTVRTQVWTIIGENTQEDNFDRTFSVSSAYYNFYGNSATAPANSAAVRALTSSFANSFQMNTGTTNKFFSIWVPPGKTLTSVIDLDALNLNITGDFVSSSLSVNDAAGTPVAGTLYVKTNGVPYSSNHRFNCIVS